MHQARSSAILIISEADDVMEVQCQSEGNEVSISNRRKLFLNVRI